MHKSWLLRLKEIVFDSMGLKIFFGVMTVFMAEVAINLAPETTSALIDAEGVIGLRAVAQEGRWKSNYELLTIDIGQGPQIFVDPVNRLSKDDIRSLVGKKVRVRYAYKGPSPILGKLKPYAYRLEVGGVVFWEEATAISSIEPFNRNTRIAFGTLLFFLSALFVKSAFRAFRKHH